MRSNILGVCSAVVSVAVAGSAVAIPTGVATNGGASWNGWTSYGLSNAAGIYGTGSTTTEYEIYQTVFTFDNNVMSLGTGYQGDSFTAGSNGGLNKPSQFANGNLIYGLGIRRTSGTATYGGATVFFDTGNNTIQAANASGGARVSSSGWGETGDFTVQFGYSASQLSVARGTAANLGGSGTNFLASGNGSGQSPFGFRGAGNGDNFQMFFDITYMNATYTQAGWIGGWTGTNSLGNYFRLSLDTGGMGARTAIQSIQVPAPGAAALLGLAGLISRRRKA